MQNKAKTAEILRYANSTIMAGPGSGGKGVGMHIHVIRNIHLIISRVAMLAIGATCMLPNLMVGWSDDKF